jgi:tetratricopeptide (TPR) repeat protein
MNRIDKLKEFLQATPNDSFLQHALALEYIKEGNDNEAKKLFGTVLDREPNYVGSYYHLGKLLERNNNIPEAINIYKNGMVEAKAAKDNHSYNELMGALEDLEDN